MKSGELRMNINWRRLIITTVTGALVAGTATAGPSDHFKVFLCFGQSNMSGGAGVGPDAASKVTNPRIQVLAFQNCGSPQRTYNTWSIASEPMHCGDGVSSMGPSFAFGQMLADSLKEDTIGLIPCGLWGVKIERFMKNGSDNSSTATINQGSISPNAYNWMLQKCKVAVERGVFSGIILVQGESNSGDGDAWLNKVKGIYNDLKKDIPLTGDVPFVAGQLLGSNALNATIAKMSTAVPMGYYASSSGLQGGGSMANLHFNQDGYRKLGERMAVETLKGLRLITTATQPQQRQRIVANATAVSSQNSKLIYTLNGEQISRSATASGDIRRSLTPGKIYVIVDKNTGTSAKLMMAPAAQ